MTSDLCPPAPRAVVPPIFHLRPSNRYVGRRIGESNEVLAADLLRCPRARTAADYRDLVELLDRVTDKAGEDEVIRLLRSWTSFEC
jgi:hypothetical protein